MKNILDWIAVVYASVFVFICAFFCTFYVITEFWVVMPALVVSIIIVAPIWVGWRLGNRDILK